MDFTICKNVIYESNNNYRILTDLLFVFTNSNNGHKVIINSLILDSYKDNQSEFIRSWINLMHNSSFFKTIENIDEDIFYKTCLKSFDKKLILINREDYENENLNKLTVYNYDEAIILLRPNNPIIVQIKGNKNQVSLGDNSPNTNL